MISPSITDQSMLIYSSTNINRWAQQTMLLIFLQKTGSLGEIGSRVLNDKDFISESGLVTYHYHNSWTDINEASKNLSKYFL